MTAATLSVPTGSDDLLRRVLRIDGWATGAFGLLMLCAAVPLRDPLGLPVSLSMPFGVAMIGGALVLLFLAGSRVLSPRYVSAVIAVNSVCVLGMIALAVSGVPALTAAGVGFALSGAVIVGVFAGLEYVGLRRMAGRSA